MLSPAFVTERVGLHENIFRLILPLRHLNLLLTYEEIGLAVAIGDNLSACKCFGDADPSCG